MKVTGQQLYKAAGLAQGAKDFRLSNRQEDDGSVNCAVQYDEPTGNESKNGWWYLQINPNGRILTVSK